MDNLDPNQYNEFKIFNDVFDKHESVLYGSENNDILTLDFKEISEQIFKKEYFWEFDHI